MKRFLLLAVAALTFVGCNNAFEDEGNVRFEQNALPTLMAGFEEDTRTYVEDNFYLRWHEGDLISAFLGNTLNNKYIFKGETGENSGTFSAVSSAELGSSYPLDNIFAIYPYDENTEMSKAGVISTLLPAEQTYAEDSFGKGANTMVAVTENLEDTFISFKNVGGYLKIRLYGEGTIKSIELRGNNGEKIAGNANITATYGGVPKIAMADDATESIMLDCGEGVMLSSDAENPTEFWVVVPPMEFSKGITISVTNAYNAVFEKSTSNKIVVERNMIQPMAAIEVEFEEVTKPANNEIWYTSTDGNIVKPYMSNFFGATIVSNTYEDGKGILTFKGDVTQIGYMAFYGCDSLTSVTIPDSVTTIGRDAFYSCDSITSITLPDSVTMIGESAFYSCGSLTIVIIGDSVTTIGCNAFFYCYSLTSVTIGDSVTTIGDDAFYGCDSLTSVTIPDSVTTIGERTFASCNNLTSVTIGDSVTTIGDEAFCRCNSLTSVTIPDSVTTIGTGAFASCDSLKEFKGKYATDNGRCLIKDNTIIAYAEASGTEYTIPDSVITIGDGAFYECYSLTSINIDDSVTTIGDEAFFGCSSLTSVNIGDSVTTIEEWAFYSCYSLTSITIPNSVTTIGDGAFYECDSLTSVTIGDSVTTIGSSAFGFCDSLTSVTIGDSVTTIGGGAFAGCPLIKEFKGKYATDNGRCLIVDNTLIAYAEASGTEYTIPDSVTTIGDAVFCYCSSLTSITIPDSVTTIGNSAFYDCRSLTSVTIGDSVTTIGDNAFLYCKSLTNVTIPDSVTTIGDGAFSWCDSLKSVYCKATTPPSIGYGVFNYNASRSKIYVPTASVNDYKTADGWSDYADYIYGYDF